MLTQGEEIGGVTAHFMTEKIDNGDIIAQIKFPILKYNYSKLCDKIVSETPNIVKKVEDFFFSNNRVPVPQDTKHATYYRENRKIHQRIFWTGLI